MEMTEVFQKIYDERLRQDMKFGANNVTLVGSPGVKLAVVTEELGEVAKEILERGETGNEFLRKELIELAACAVAWIESLEV